MSQRASLAQLDADIHAAMLDAGMADEGTYTPPVPAGADPDDPPPAAVACLLYVDRGVQTMGDYGSVLGRRTVVTLVADGLPGIEQGGIVAADGETFRLEARTNVLNDGSLEQWVVEHV